jgi:hypothetical protein
VSPSFVQFGCPFSPEGPVDDDIIVQVAHAGEDPYFVIPSSTTVSSLKERIQQRSGIPVDRQRLFWGTYKLEDSEILARRLSLRGPLRPIVLLGEMGSHFRSSSPMPASAHEKITVHIDFNDLRAQILVSPSNHIISIQKKLEELWEVPVGL